MMTNTIDARMRYCALALQDQALLVKLSAFDVMEEDHAKYHSTCSVALYNRMRSVESEGYVNKSADTHEARRHGTAFAQLVA